MGLSRSIYLLDRHETLVLENRSEAADHLAGSHNPFASLRARMRVNRRRFLQAGAAGAAGAALLPATGCSMDETGSRKHMNVLVLIVDSLRPDHVGAYGSPQVRTPNIDALAAKGVRFNRAFPEAMVTIPARRSIFTSRRIFPYRHFVPNPELGVSPGWEPIKDPANTTFTSVFQREGYWTA